MLPSNPFRSKVIPTIANLEKRSCNENLYRKPSSGCVEIPLHRLFKRY
jgi:hypothetical protein